VSRSLKCAATPIVAVLLAVGVFSSDLVERQASATPPSGGTQFIPSFGSGRGGGGSRGGGSDYPSRSRGGGESSPSHGSGPNWSGIIDGVINGLGNSGSHHPEYPQNPGWQPQYTPVFPTPTIRPPRQTYQPPPRRQEQQPLPNTIAAPPKPNKVEVPVNVEKNVDFSLTAEGMTAAVLAAWRNQAQQQNEQVSGEIGKLIAQDAAGALAGLADITRKANAGALTNADLQAFAAMMRPGLAAGMSQSANQLFYRLTVLSRLTAILNTAIPGAGGLVPVGNRVSIVLVPGLPRGQVILLGNGAVLVGVGHLCRYVTVGRGNVAQCVGMTVGIGPPVPDTEAKLVSDGTLLINGEDAQVNYNLNGHPYTMNAGYRQPLSAGRTWVIAFDRGGSFGETRYTLSEGTYKFSMTDEGWALFKYTFDVNIDNGENPFEFRYVVDNEHQTLPAGRVNRHSNLYPLLVRFDNGKGQTKAKRIESGTYEVAVTQENTLDLVADDAVAEPSIGPPQPNPAPATSTTFVTPAVATTTRVGDAFGSNPFGGRGDWRPSLFVSDVPEVDYFGDPEVAGG
jgi:hypothetical protein